MKNVDDFNETAVSSEWLFSSMIELTYSTSKKGNYVWTFSVEYFNSLIDICLIFNLNYWWGGNNEHI